LRGLLQFQFVTLPSFRMTAPRELTAENIAAPLDLNIKNTSIGSPETDRGPPRSR
jgi:hypothetical protein